MGSEMCIRDRSIAKQQIAHLRRQYDLLVRERLPVGMLGRAPETMPLPPEISKEVCDAGADGGEGAWSYERLINKWRSAARDGGRTADSNGWRAREERVSALPPLPQETHSAPQSAVQPLFRREPTYADGAHGTPSHQSETHATVPHLRGRRAWWADEVHDGYQDKDRRVDTESDGDAEGEVDEGLAAERSRAWVGPARGDAGVDGVQSSGGAQGASLKRRGSPLVRSGKEARRYHVGS